MSGMIWNYDGIAWKENVRFERSRENDITFFNIWGDSPSNIFATGYSGLPENMTSITARYEGTKWELNEFPNLKYNLVSIRKDIESGKYYLLGIENKPDGGEIFGLFEYDGNKNIKQIFEGTEGQSGWAFVQQIDGRIFFGQGDTIFKYVNGEYKSFLKVNDIDFWTGFYGRTEKDIFLIMAYGLAHYNGIDIEYLYKNSNKIHILDAVIFKEEVFFLVVDPTINGNLIIHGRLN